MACATCTCTDLEKAAGQSPGPDCGDNSKDDVSCGPGQKKVNGVCVPITDKSNTNNPLNDILANYLQQGGTFGADKAVQEQNAATRLKQYELELAKAQTAAGGASERTKYLLEQLKTAGQVPSSISTLLKDINDTGTTYIGNQYDTAQKQTTAGYDALRNYLTNNPINTYSQARAAMAPQITNDLATYAASQGVNSQGVNPLINSLNAASAGGANNYDRLLQTLAATQLASNQSRLAEEQMSRTLSGTNLSQLQQQALYQLLQQKQKAQLEAQQQAVAREQALQDAVGTLVGGGYTTATGEQPSWLAELLKPKVVKDEDKPADKPAQLTAVQQLKAIPIKASNTALNKRIDNFIAANPNATVEQVKNEFKKITKKIK
jgi:hypothetical protein